MKCVKLQDTEPKAMTSLIALFSQSHTYEYETLNNWRMYFTRHVNLQ